MGALLCQERLWEIMFRNMYPPGRPQGRPHAAIFAGDRADVCVDIAGAQVAFVHACGPSAKLFDHPWVVQGWSESFHGRSVREVFSATLLSIDWLKFAKVAHTVARHPPVF